MKVSGIDRFVALGYSRKFWFQEELSTDLSSITSPGVIKKVYLDPALLPLIKDQRVLIIDDAVSTGISLYFPFSSRKLFLPYRHLRPKSLSLTFNKGKTLQAIWDFLESEALNCRVTSVGVAMKQGSRWKEVLGDERAEKVIGVFDSPLLKAVEDGWVVRE
jgi:hypothetical protein